MNNKELQDSIIYQDALFLIANKPAGLGAQKDLTKDLSFHELLEKYVYKKLYLINRLDRPTSGIMVFAKKKKAASYFTDLNNDPRIEKIYFAAVKNSPAKPVAELVHYLVHDSKQRKSLVSKKDDNNAKEARLTYRILDKIDNYTLLEVKLASGRFHQIRAQLSAIGSPIKGDVKYGARRANKDRSINLHSKELSFPLMYDEEGIKISAGVPQEPVWEAFAAKNPEILENKSEKWKIKN